MRKNTIGRILTLAAQGFTVKDIATEVGCQPGSVEQVLTKQAQKAEQPTSSPSPSTPVRSLSEAARLNRESMLRSVEFYSHQLFKIDRLANALLPDDEDEVDLNRVKPGLIHTLTVTRAITMDKMSESLRQLRALESESAETLEMAFTLIEELADGTRRLVGEPPELARWRRGGI